ncbi:MAG TPA: penicillin-binding protein 1B [Gammaproteobacteria bacterium]
MTDKHSPDKKTSRRKPSKPGKAGKHVTKSSSRQDSPGVLRRLFLNKISASVLLLVFLLSSLYVVYLDILITEKMSGRIWSFPSTVYARPLELYKNKAISIEDISSELDLLDYRKVNTRPAKPGQYRVYAGAYIELISRDFNFSDGFQASQGLRIKLQNNYISRLEALNSNQVVDVFRLDPMVVAGIYPKQQEVRQLIQLEQVPDDLVLALLSVEDRRFYQHWGLDPRSIARAFMANLMAGKTVQGGSTLTQQLVKNIFLSADRTLIRKINEAIMALLLEFHYDKSTILETYINEVYLGQHGATQIHGFQLASQFYFSRDLNRLSRDQMALLVGMVKGPSWYHPRRHPERALERRNQVLALMLEKQVINQSQYNLYAARPLGLTHKPKLSSNRYPALVDLVKRQLQEDYNETDLKTAGLNIFTSIDPIIQEKAEKSVSEVLPRLERSQTQTAPLQASVIVASSEQGEIQALVSDRSPKFAGFNRSLDAVRQIGSLIKPAIYLSALQYPERYTLASMLKDVPLHLKTSKGDVWSPQNYDGETLGEITLFEALRDSRNIPSVRLGLDIGLAEIADTLHNLGVRRDIPTYPSMTLGAFSLSPLDVANMYQTFAARGYHIPLRVIREVLDKDNQPLTRYPLAFSKTLDEKSVHLVNHVLHEVTRSGTAASLQRILPLRVAGKTGTTDDLRDSWFAGFSDEQLAVVWIGRDDNSSTQLTGASGALQLWGDLMGRLPINDLSLTPPAGIEQAWIELKSGASTNKNCPSAVKLPFITGSVPTEKAKCDTGGLFDQIKQFFN